ncbi:uncharacterized protein LOC134221355 [Armigeres subalbatus]|uniref:uncharacterized protein LOC134221355 n=1 Tax=Armigeres subalbatus TaxID=124917 RepID=UPI002ED4981D
MANVFFSLVFCLAFAQLAHMYPQNADYGRRGVREYASEPLSNNVVRKDIFVLEIPEAAIEDEIEEQMAVMMERRAKQQLALDRFVLKLYEEFRRREQEGTLNVHRQRL